MKKQKNLITNDVQQKIGGLSAAECRNQKTDLPPDIILSRVSARPIPRMVELGAFLVPSCLGGFLFAGLHANVALDLRFRVGLAALSLLCPASPWTTLNPGGGP